MSRIQYWPSRVGVLWPPTESRCLVVMPAEGTETQVLKRVHTRLPRCCVAELGIKPELWLGLPEKQEQHTRSHQVGRGSACKALPPQTKVKDDSWEAELALGVGGRALCLGEQVESESSKATQQHHYCVEYYIPLGDAVTSYDFKPCVRSAMGPLQMQMRW